MVDREGIQAGVSVHHLAAAHALSTVSGGLVLGGALPALVEGFRRALLREERSPNTIRSYAWALKDFLLFCAKQGVVDGAHVTREVVEEWQDSTREHMRPSSRSLASAAVRGLLTWGIERDAFDPKATTWLAKVRKKANKPRPIPHDDLVKLIQHLDREARLRDPMQLRDRALFLYLLTTGARVSEAMQVRRAEIERAIVIQKGGTEKELQAPPLVIEAIQDYLSFRRDDLPWLWVTLETETIRPLRAPGVRERWRKLAKRAGVHYFTTHQLRHTNATEMLDAGVDSSVAADWLGHHDLSTLQNYGQVTPKQRRVALDAMEKLVAEAREATPRQVFLPRVLPRLKRRPR